MTTSVEDINKHLEFIQMAITRMAGNSFLLKGWTVTLAAAIVGLAAKDSNPNFILLALFPAASFWGLDAYYLRQERLFRALYDAVRSSAETEVFSLSTAKFRREVPSWFRLLMNPSIFFLHGVVIGSVLIIRWILS